MQSIWKKLLTVLCLATIVGCEQSSPQMAEPRQQITVAYTLQPQSTLIHVAVAKGYFAEEGLDVQSLIYTFGRVSLQTLLDHKSDFAAVAETPVMFNILKGEKIFVIANVEASTDNNAIVARKDSGISTLNDLKGKRIGFTPGTTSEFFLDALLITIGLTRQAIHPVAMNPEEMLGAITEQRVDAVCTWNYPLIKIQRQLGANGTIFFDHDIYTETYNIAVQQDFVHKHAKTVQRFLRALIKAEQFVAQHPGAAQSIMSTATTTDLDLVRKVWNVFNYRVTLDQKLLITLENETRWAMKNRFTNQTVMPDYRHYIYTDSLRAVKPAAVKPGMW